MLIVYRTNAGFEGQIQEVDYTTPGPIFDAGLQRPENPIVDLAYIELDPLTVPASAHLDLALNQELYTVDPSGPALLRNGVVVYSVPEAPTTQLGDSSNLDKSKSVVDKATFAISWAGATGIQWN